MIENPSLDEPVGSYSLHCFGPNVKVAFSGRKYPAIKYSEFLEAYDLNPVDLVTVKQTHGDGILIVKDDREAIQGQEADGLLTQSRGVILGVKTADCIPAFFWNPQVQVIGIAHAGWRGLQKEILPKMVQKMTDEFEAPADLTKVAFGPCIRQCCYEVGPEFKDYFDKHCDAKGHLDLLGIARDQLSESGILPNQVFECGICTHCESNIFFSARKEKTDERILSVIQMKPISKKSV